MSSPSQATRLLLVLLLLLLIHSPRLHATDITDVRWQGEDLLIRFSDSVPYSVDLAESDTSQVILRLSPLTLPASLATKLQGPSGRTAILTGAAPNELRVTIRSNDRMGYGTIWRPYSHTLVVHTFRWRQLGYSEEQYFKGLLAFEQRLDAQGIEFLRLAYAAGDRRAASALGIYYARHGEEALAAQYLTQPLEADDFAALAQVKRSMGDAAAAAEMERSFTQLTDSRRGGIPPATSDQAPLTDDSTASSTGMTTPLLSRENIPTIAAVGGGVLLLIIVIILITRRPRPDTSPGRVVAVGDGPTDAATRTDVEEETEAESPVVQEATEPESRMEEEAAGVAPQTAPAQGDRRAMLSSQAEDLRRRIEEMRAKSEERIVGEADTEADPTIVSEARRLRLSRDSVELRRRLENTR